jgi:hypothetical protein
MRERQVERQREGLAAKRCGQYCFSIILIDDKSRIELANVYRITMHRWKENDMTRYANTALAAFVALILSIASIGAIVTVPPAEASATAKPA